VKSQQHQCLIKKSSMTFCDLAIRTVVYERQTIFCPGELIVFNERIEVLWPYAELLRLSRQMPLQDGEETTIKNASQYGH
jgi:hypothetical protein